MALDQVTPATFEPHLGSALASSLGDAPFTLVGIERYTATPEAPRPEPFSLYFERPGEVVAQQTVALTHAVLGSLELFLVPIGQAGDVVRYEAAFN